ncbi:MAG: glucuronate isomerase [Gemmataceae bacterium]|nr:glucuronate isomerase [Gemmataceae bacterium]MDW8267351.1 glucuronate isomerase [Gemmataceae bacterium]
MLTDSLAAQLYAEICRIPLIDSHSHINPLQAASRSLDDILGYHYYTELAHSAGMSKAPLAAHVDPRERVRIIIEYMDRFDNTAQYGWFVDIARTFLGFTGERITPADATGLCETAERLMAQPDWEEQVLRKSNIEKVFLTNDFDDPLEGFDTNRYVPCLRTDDLVFHLDKPEVRQRLAKATNVEVHSWRDVQTAVTKLFEHFTRKGARACAVSLPPNFTPTAAARWEGTTDPTVRSQAIFWLLADHCRAFKLPFDLMIGVNRRVYANGVYQGQDLFDQRTSLIQYAELFNSFPDVIFPISVLTSVQNQELASYSWIFPNVITHGHWWYSNIPVYVERDTRARLQAVPKTKQIGYYSDMYKLEFGLPKFNMYRRILAGVLADDFVRAGSHSETQALELARLLLRDNSRRIFGV